MTRSTAATAATRWSAALAMTGLTAGEGAAIRPFPVATAGVTLNLALTSAQSTGGAGTDTLLNVEHVTGSNHADVITGSTGANSLSGGTGNDALNGAARH